MALTENQSKHRCLAYGGARRCRYLENDRTNWRLFHCLKQVPARKRAIDKKVAKFMAEQRQHGHDPFQGYQACGDGGNCPGYPYLPTVQQGYDVTHQKKPKKA